MCNTNHTTREPRLYLHATVGFGQRVLSYSAAMDQESFVARGRTHDATLRILKLIVVAATHIPTGVCEFPQEVPRHTLIQTRGRLGPSYPS